MSIKKPIIFIFAFLLIFSITASANDEYSYNIKDTDILVFEATDYADFLFEYNLFQGKDGGYKLDEEITRAEAITVLVRLLGKTPVETELAFTDVPSNHWASSYIAYAKKSGYINGINEHEFAPDRNVTGIEFTKMSMSILGYNEVTIENAVETGESCGMLSNEYLLTAASDYVLKRNDIVLYMFAILNSKNSEGSLQKEIVIKERNLNYEKFNFEFEEICNEVAYISDFCCSNIMSFSDTSLSTGLWYFCVDKEGTYHVATGIIEVARYAYEKAGEWYINETPSENSIAPAEYFLHIDNQGQVKLTKKQLIKIKELVGEVLLDRPYELGFTMHTPEITANINGKKYVTSTNYYDQPENMQTNTDLLYLQNELIGLSPIAVKGRVGAVSFWTGFKDGYESGELLENFQKSEAGD